MLAPGIPVPPGMPGMAPGMPGMATTPQGLGAMAAAAAAAAGPVHPLHAPGPLHVAALQAALWSTLQADLLYVLWALMGGKTKQEAQKTLVKLGLVEVLQAMFERLDWRPPPAPPHSAHHGAGC
eukprot:scaffold83149_cov33-Phaeocystis_antarctica.AAC.1